MTETDIEIFEADAKDYGYIRNQLERKLGDPKRD